MSAPRLAPRCHPIDHVRSYLGDDDRKHDDGNHHDRVLRAVQRRPDGMVPRRQPAVIAEKLTRAPGRTPEPHQL